MNRQGHARTGVPVDLIGERARLGVEDVADDDPRALGDEQSGFGGALTRERLPKSEPLFL